MIWTARSSLGRRTASAPATRTWCGCSPDHVEREERFFRETGVSPIMHLIAVRRQVLDEHPWVARNLLDALTESKPRSVERIEPNRATLAQLLRYAHLHGIAHRAVAVDEVFPGGLETKVIV